MKKIFYRILDNIVFLITLPLAILALLEGVFMVVAYLIYIVKGGQKLNSDEILSYMKMRDIYNDTYDLFKIPVEKLTGLKDGDVYDSKADL